MRENCTYGSVRGALSNGRPYRDRSRFQVSAHLPEEISRQTKTPGSATTSEQIVTALQTGLRPDGRVLAPIMPWHAFANLTKEDAMAIAVFLKSIPPVKHAVAGPFAPGEKIAAFLFRILPPGETAAAAPK